MKAVSTPADSRLPQPGIRRITSLRWLVTQIVLALCAASLAGGALAGSAPVQLVRTPNGGIQPQAVVDDQGVLHLIYFKGKAGAGDIFYLRQKPGEETFSRPIQVNSQPGSAIAVGTIRGAHLAVGRKGRAHVAWNGSRNAEKGTHPGAPMLYSRLNEAGTAFEPERDVMTETAFLDGGGSVAADNEGNVYVMWHAFPSGNSEGEASRAVFVARSSDDGKTFTREQPANPKPTGACGCCGMRAFADRRGNVFALYRAASEQVNRDEILLVSRNHGASFDIANAHPWNIATCPMSSAFLSDTPTGALAAWETDGQIYFAAVEAKALKVSPPVSPPGRAKRKHPVAVANGRGEVLVAWAEGTGWEKGGAVAWQLFDPSGKPTEEKGRADGVPVWGLVAAAPRADGSFTIFY